MLEKFVDRLPIMPVIQPLMMKNQIPYYDLTMKESMLKLHRDLPPTRVWGYNGLFPGPTFHVFRGQPIRVLWRSALPEKHFLPIDTTVHGADHGAPEVRTVVHLHGGVTPDTSDGYPEAWFTPGFQQVGRYFTNAVYEYPNDQAATNLWYHDHAMGITRLNIYAGLAGMYIVHDEEEQSLWLPDGEFDIPLVLQDRSFRADGSLYYPAEPTPPVEGVDPSVLPDFFGKTNLVNGKVWPYLEVEPRKYRFRILNGANARFYGLSLSNDLPFLQIGTDQGLLEHPVPVTNLLLAPAERADVVIDFSSSAGEEIVMRNGAASPFPQGKLPNPKTTGVVMQFRVKKHLSSPDHSNVPHNLSTYHVMNPVQSNNERNLLLSMRPDEYGRSIHLLNDQLWTDPITEMPRLGDVEIWSLVNVSNATHPIHLHLVKFQILDRQPFDAEVYENEGRIVPTGKRMKPALNEQGWKDTVRANPKEITRIIMKFEPYAGLFVWHCHILEHEDYEMMRPYVVVGKG
ncbi:multicopper oxidase family protein [Guptibacillus hwajinpoensis]|uniref:Spore coat protein A n=1 Tax=Guptibacillus hwajinpoensis TaxID=208199 RepID=A0ABU0K3X1_9BACL|nr:multicopper oxidase [Alkalihalobacillus hemicentroti]MDQ0483989.1 spore coat protein A [Alkalihalobacillus hemicentroti]